MHAYYIYKKYFIWLKKLKQWYIDVLTQITKDRYEKIIK